MSSRIPAPTLARRADGTGRHSPWRLQHGAFLLTFALTLLFLLGFMGIALDFGRLFIVKTELQTAMDSCALAAARELNGQSDAITRAQSAGMTAGNGNNANLQSSNWNGAGKITSGDITFRDKDYVATNAPAGARYAECQYTMSSIQLWLLQAMGAFTSDSATWSSTSSVGARAVATRGVAQSSCPIPVQLKQSKFSTLSKGDWIIALTKSGNSGSDFGWANLDGSTSATETWSEMEGKYCSTQFPPLPIGTSGVKTSVFEYWNHRFGIYKGTINASNGPTASRPDYTGYIYTSTNWPSKFNAYNGPASGSTQNFITQRQLFTPCGPSCPINGSNETAIGTTQLQSYGADRRLVLTPVVDAVGNVVNFACMLMLQPIPSPIKEDIYLEYRGNASDLDSPCTTTGLAGGTNGPLVPVLVR